MGDPRKLKKKYSKPKTSWSADKIEEERGITRTYGLKNKKELWRAQAMLRNFRGQARKLLALKTEQGKKEERQLVGRLRRLNLLRENASLDDVLALKLDNVLERRLETLVFKKGLASTPNQARQFIVHGHIAVHGQKVTAPGYLVKADEESTISYVEGSTVKNAVQIRREEEPKREEAAEKRRGRKRREAKEEKPVVKEEAKEEKEAEPKAEEKTSETAAEE